MAAELAQQPLDAGLAAGAVIVLAIADAFVSQVVVLPDTAGANAGKILIAGGFTSFNGQLRNGIARLYSFHTERARQGT